MTPVRFILCTLIVWLSASGLSAARVKDLAQVEGGRDNQLVGYGIVVGLNGDGDSNATATLRSVTNAMRRFGLELEPEDIKAKNAAAVMITADIGPFLRPGARIDATVASIGDAKALQGGVLLQTPLLGADGRVYAVAQGAVAVGGFLGGAGGLGGATVQKNHPTVGLISNGAIVEREIPTTLVQDGRLRMQLHNPDFTSAMRMAHAINSIFPDAAIAEDAATVAVDVPPEYAGRDVEFIAHLGAVQMAPDTLARVVINERTGTIVATSSVRLSEVAISHGSLTITVSSNLAVSAWSVFRRTNSRRAFDADRRRGIGGGIQGGRGKPLDRSPCHRPECAWRKHARDDGHFSNAQERWRSSGRTDHQLTMSISPLSHSISPSMLQPIEANHAAKGPTSPADLQKAAGQFEAVLLRQFLQPTMDSMLSGTAGGGGGPGSDIYGYFLTDVISGALSESGGMGLSNILQHQLGAEAPADASNLS